jgi:hypothetical protein
MGPISSRDIERAAMAMATIGVGVFLVILASKRPKASFVGIELLSAQLSFPRRREFRLFDISGCPFLRA